MKIYKVIITKTVFVKAENDDEAIDNAYDDEYICIDEKVEHVTESSVNEMIFTMECIE